jgi:hypothetical protein
MAKKSIIEIDVQDEKWQKFMENFHAYEEALGAMPEDWKKIGEAMGHSGGIFSQTAQRAMESLMSSASHISDMADGLKKATKAQEQFGRATGVSRSGMKGLVKDAESLSKNLFGIGKMLFKMTTVGALAGAIGMFGLGEAAFRRQREARGFGMSTGTVAAFRTNMSQFVNPDALLSTAANLPYNLENIGPLALMGLNRNAMIREAPEKRAFDIINRAHALWGEGRRNQWDPMVQNLQKLGLSYEDYRRIGMTPLSQLQAAERATMRDTRGMNIDKTAEAFAKLKIEVQRAGMQIESTLVNGLAPLAPKMIDLAKALTGDFVHWMNEPSTQKSIAKMGESIGHFAKFLGSKEFKKDLDDFGTAIKDVTGAVLWAAEKIGVVSGWSLGEIGQGIENNPKTTLAGAGVGLVMGGPLGAVAGATAGSLAAQVPQTVSRGFRAMVQNDVHMAEASWYYMKQWMSGKPQRPRVNAAPTVRIIVPPGHSIHKSANALAN